MLSVLPSGSLNQATFAPVGVVLIPRSSCCMNPKRSEVIPMASNSLTEVTASGTF